MELAKKLLGEYVIFRIYRLDLTALVPAGESCDGFSEIVQEHTQEPSRRNGYGGYQSHGFRFVENGCVLATCWFWYGERYRERNFWPLKEGEAKLVRIETAPQARGRNIAPRLIRYASLQMAERGFRTLYARVWHSYQPSRRAFYKAGWSLDAFVVEYDLLGRRRRHVFSRLPGKTGPA